MKWIAVVVLLVAAFFAGRFTGALTSKRPTGRKILYYVDPMHPAYKSDKPGIAPDCGMKLEPVYEEGGPAKTEERKALYYRDPKNHEFRSPNPGLNPETGNDLEPVYKEEGTIQVSDYKQQLIGVRFEEARLEAGDRQFRATGKVVLDETRISKVHSKLEGWIDQVHVDFTGKEVRKGQPLLTLYSPEMLATQQEYLLALRTREVMKASTLHEAMSQSESLIDASRRRLELWDFTPEQIEELGRTKTPLKNITIYSPASGFVMARNSFPKQRIMPDTELYTIADLSHVWIVADVSESDVSFVRAGQRVNLSLPSYPGRQLAATVSYIQPQMDAETRTLKVRIEAENPAMRLKPEMFVDVDFHVMLPSRLTAPNEAVLDTGMKQTVYVDRGNGDIEPRAVEIGDRTGDRIEIRKGLRAGERVVSSGNFLIDSESQLKRGSK